MTFWFLQILFNIAAAAWIVITLLSRKRVHLLENELNRFSERILELERRGSLPLLTQDREAFPREPSVIAEPALPSLPILATPASHSTLSEKKVTENHAPGMDAYEKADVLFARGLSMTEVVRQTGLSLSELQLLRKMAQRNQ